MRHSWKTELGCCAWIQGLTVIKVIYIYFWNVCFVLTLKFSKRYTQRSCYSVCKQRNIVEKCNCAWSEYLSFYSNLNFCSTIKELECVSAAKKYAIEPDYLPSVCYQECPEECFKAIYNGIQTFNNFNTEIYLNSISNRNNYSSIYDNQTLSEDNIRYGLTKLNIYYALLSYRKMDDCITLDSLGLFGAIGGFGALFLGVSLLSLVEILEIFVRFV